MCNWRNICPVALIQCRGLQFSAEDYSNKNHFPKSACDGKEWQICPVLPSKNCLIPCLCHVLPHFSVTSEPEVGTEVKPSEADLYEFQSEDEDGHKMQPGEYY